MKNPLKKCFITLCAFSALAVSLFAQDVQERVPHFEIKKVDFKTTQVEASDAAKPWGRTQIDFRVLPGPLGGSTGAPGFNQNDWLTGVKITLTLVYKKTAAAYDGSRARGAKAEAKIDKLEKEEGSKWAKYVYYRASTKFVALKVGDSQRSVSFFLPGEIIERDKLIGRAEPEYYYVEFEYNGNKIPLLDGKSNPTLKNSMPPVTKIAKSRVEFDEFLGTADSSVSDTKGLLLSQQYVPFSAWPKNSSTIVRSEVEQ